MKIETINEMYDAITKMLELKATIEKDKEIAKKNPDNFALKFVALVNTETFEAEEDELWTTIINRLGLPKKNAKDEIDAIYMPTKKGEEERKIFRICDSSLDELIDFYRKKVYELAVEIKNDKDKAPVLDKEICSYLETLCLLESNRRARNRINELRDLD